MQRRQFIETESTLAAAGGQGREGGPIRSVSFKGEENVLVFDSVDGHTTL